MAAQVHDVDGCAGHLRDGERAVHPVCLEPGGPGQGVVLRIDVAVCERDLDDLVDHDAILGVHADEHAVFPRFPHRAEDGRVVGEEDIRVGHEELVARHALVGEPAHLRHPPDREVRDDHMEGVVDRRGPGGLGVPGVQPLDGGGAPGSGPRSR